MKNLNYFSFTDVAIHEEDFHSEYCIRAKIYDLPITLYWDRETGKVSIGTSSCCRLSPEGLKEAAQYYNEYALLAQMPFLAAKEYVLHYQKKQLDKPAGSD